MIAYERKERPIHHRIDIRMTGPAASGAKADAATLRDLLGVLIEGAQGALRLRLEGRSRTPGPAPKWLRQAARFEVLGFEEGSTVVALAAPSVREANPRGFAQGHLFQDFDPDLSSLQLFEESLGEALRGRDESDLFDQALLGVMFQFKKVLGTGVERIEMHDRANGGSRICLDRNRLGQVEHLIRQTPPDQRVRLAGQLDTIRHSDRMFVLVLEDGQSIRGLAETVDPRQLAALFGHQAVVSGKAVFRPSGSVLRIEIDQLEPAGADASVWSHMPRPALGGAESKPLTRSQGPRSGVNRIFGQWPGEESEEEILQALEGLVVVPPTPATVCFPLRDRHRGAVSVADQVADRCGAGHLAAGTSGMAVLRDLGG